MDDVKKLSMGELGVYHINRKQDVENMKRDAIRIAKRIVEFERVVKSIRDELILRLEEDLLCKEMNIKLCEKALDAGIVTFTSGIVVQEKLDTAMREYREIKDYLEKLYVEAEISAVEDKLHNS